MRRPFDITAFTADFHGERYRFSAERATVTALDPRNADTAKRFAEEYATMAGMMRSDPGLRHCDSGHAFAVELKRQGAKVWQLKMRHYPKDTIF